MSCGRTTNFAVQRKQLHSTLRRSYGLTVSLPNLYKTVGKLLEYQILVKTDRRLALNRLWLSQVIRFAERAQKTYLVDESELVQLPESQGKSRTYTADSLAGLDPIWNHTLIKLMEKAKRGSWYIYASHPWYWLGMRDTEIRLFRSIVEQGISCHMLYGNDSFLDKYGAKCIRMKGLRSVVSSSTSFPSEGYSVWVCTDYLVECFYPETIARHFKFFFQAVRRIEDFDPELFSDVFKMRARCSVTIQRDSEQAKALRLQLQSHFR